MLLIAMLAAAAAEAPVVVISGTRTERASFDVPASIDAVTVDDSQPRVNVSEALISVPGLVVQNRQNLSLIHI